MDELRIDFNVLPWESPAKGIRFKTAQQNGRKLRMLEFSKGFVEPDWCMRGHIGFVLEGAMEVDFNGNRVHYSKGDGVFIPHGEATKHMAKVDDFVKLILVEDV